MNPIDHSTLHRGAKYFMDSGRAISHEEAMNLLRDFGLTIHVGVELTQSVAHQIALLTLINITHRTFLGGIAVVGLSDCSNLTRLSLSQTLKEACSEFGGVIANVCPAHWPSALIGTVEHDVVSGSAAWHVTWEGWRGGAMPLVLGGRLVEDDSMLIAPALAASLCAAEAFSFHAKDNPLAGRRAAGLSLWNPSAEWLVSDGSEPEISYLPSNLWIIGLGNLGQAFAWLLACLPYEQQDAPQIVLQDFDCLAPSNVSTSLLSFTRDTGKIKTVDH